MRTSSSSRIPRSLILTVSSDIFFGGLLIGVGFTPEAQAGQSLALALTVLLGATLGAVAFTGLQGFVLIAMSSFGAAALLDLVTEELLVEAHEV